MRAWEKRPLTEGEIRLGRSFFGDEIDWPAVRIAQAPAMLFSAMVPFGSTIWFGTWRAAHDFTQAFRTEQAWFVHELVHVWQAQRGTMLAFAKLRALHKHDYHVHLKTGAPLTSYNIEAQAEIVRFLFLARLGQPTPHRREDLEEVWASRRANYPSS